LFFARACQRRACFFLRAYMSAYTRAHTCTPCSECRTGRER
jgi:hypothetical protein